MNKVCPRCGKKFITFGLGVQLCASCLNSLQNQISQAKVGKCSLCFSNLFPVSKISRLGYICNPCRTRISKNYISLPYSSKCPICAGILETSGICIPCHNDFLNGGRK